MRQPFTAEMSIRLGRADLPVERARIEQAAKDAGAFDMIMDFDHQWQQLLDRMFKQGIDLSGGQWQRLASARGLYRDECGLLIADEPSAALDAFPDFQQLSCRLSCNLELGSNPLTAQPSLGKLRLSGRSS
jgi:ATP-binding cassette, subfamily B, bacterial